MFNSKKRVSRFAMYSVFDKKSGFFKPPFHAESDEDLLRNFASTFESSLRSGRLEGNMFFNYAADFAVYGVSGFDEQMQCVESKPTIVFEMLEARRLAEGNVRSLDKYIAHSHKTPDPLGGGINETSSDVEKIFS